jgi:hypothetical protein
MIKSLPQVSHLTFRLLVRPGLRLGLQFYIIALACPKPGRYGKMTKPCELY